MGCATIKQLYKLEFDHGKRRGVAPPFGLSVFIQSGLGLIELGIDAIGLQ